MSTIAIIAILLALLIAGFLIVASMRPDTFRVQRSIDINAPADKIYPLISDYKHWASWSPYEKMDPAMKRTFSGSSSGRGAVYEWAGNKNIGRGRMEIVDAVPPSKIGIKLDFFSPFEAHNIAEFSMLPKGEATNVTWALHGPVLFMAKIMHMIFSMDRMVGQFEEGLANMKAVAER